MFDWCLSPFWVLSVRSEFLTPIFKLCVFLTSPYLYIFIISLGFWLKRKLSLWMSLAFLIPFSTIFNNILKFTFNISRPPESLWLVTPSDALGFPSGEVQVATVFMSMLALNLKSKLAQLMCVGVVLLVAASRVYLGVHTICDVTAAVLVALITVYCWNLPINQKYITSWWGGKTILPLLMSILLCALLLVLAVWQKFVFAKSTLTSIGILLGFSLSLLGSIKVIEQPPKLNLLLVFGILLSVTMSVLTLFVIPSVGTHLIVLKYALIAIIIFYISPKLLLRYFYSYK